MRKLVAAIMPVLFVAAIASLPDSASAAPIDAGSDSGLSAHCAVIAARLALPPDHGRCDTKTCTPAGGICAYAGFCFGQACVKKTHDAGRTCTDSAQCEGGCLARPNTPPGPGTGECSPTAITLGCHVWVSKAVVSSGPLCGD